jgi:hypothetical protein
MASQRRSKRQSSLPALGKNPERYRKDAATLKEATKTIGSVDADTYAQTQEQKYKHHAVDCNVAAVADCMLN